MPKNDTQVVDITLDSREVRAGALFLALRGGRSHGLEFAADAAARGASAVLWEPGAGSAAPILPPAVFAAPVADLGDLAGRIADRFFGRPSSQLRIVGVTGTNGKTTCAYLIAQCLERLKFDAAYMGTIGWGRIAALEVPTHTTPDAVSVHRTLAELKSQGVRVVAMEVSSHALDQGRVDGVRFHSAAFTNLTPRPFGLPPLDSSLRRGEGAPVRGSGSAARHHQHRRPLRPRAGAALCRPRCR